MKMTSIVKAKEKDFQLLAGIGKISYIESHGSSAKPADINAYLDENYSYEVFENELRDPKNIYNIIYHNNQPAGYSKIILNTPQSNIPIKNITKLERLYLLKEFYGFKLGFELFNWNLELTKNSNQAGMWLYVWKENLRAISFYKKTGFKVIGSYDFKLTETHSNPNHLMFLKY
jgi:ribosomal protein S18 acetylase RimI-like enzyme